MQPWMIRKCKSEIRRWKKSLQAICFCLWLIYFLQIHPLSSILCLHLCLTHGFLPTCVFNFLYIPPTRCLHSKETIMHKCLLLCALQCSLFWLNLNVGIEEPRSGSDKGVFWFCDALQSDTGGPGHVDRSLFCVWRLFRLFPLTVFWDWGSCPDIFKRFTDADKRKYNNNWKSFKKLYFVYIHRALLRLRLIQLRKGDN